jgi:hypothetical protein
MWLGGIMTLSQPYSSGAQWARAHTNRGPMGPGQNARAQTQEYKKPSGRAFKKNSNSVAEALQKAILNTRLKNV